MRAYRRTGGGRAPNEEELGGDGLIHGKEPRCNEEEVDGVEQGGGTGAASCCRRVEEAGERGAVSARKAGARGAAGAAHKV